MSKNYIEEISPKSDTAKELLSTANQLKIEEFEFLETKIKCNLTVNREKGNKIKLSYMDNVTTNYPLSIPLGNKCAIFKTLCYTINWVLWSIARKKYDHQYPILFSVTYPHPNSTLSSQEKQIKKQVWLKSQQITKILVSRYCVLIQQALNLTSSELEGLYRLGFRLYPQKSKYSRFTGDISGIMERFRLIRCQNTRIDYDTMISDFKKYSVPLIKYVIENMAVENNYSFKYYMYLIQKAPSILKRCKYNLCFSEEDINTIKILQLQPKNRYQYFMLKVAINYSSMRITEVDPNTRETIKKFVNSNIKVWHAFRKYRRITSPYSCRELQHMLHTIGDGKNIYERYKENLYNIKVAEVKGSALKMVQAAIYNHRQEQEINKKNMLAKPNIPMPTPPIILPKWIENIRLKSHHDMIKAGLECEHCIGSYIYSSDIFVREKNICAQIDRKTLEISQCYDINDRITKESEDLKQRLNKDLIKLRKENKK